MASVGKYKGIEIEVSSDGRFSCDLPDYGTVRTDTHKDLTGKIDEYLRKRKRKKEVDVTIVDIDTTSKPAHVHEVGVYRPGRGLLHAVLRGVHERTSAVLLKHIAPDAGKLFQLDGYQFKHGDQILRRLTLAECMEYTRLTEAIDKAKADYDAWRKARTVDPKTATADED